MVRPLELPGYQEVQSGPVAGHRSHTSRQSLEVAPNDRRLLVEAIPALFSARLDVARSADSVGHGLDASCIGF